MSILVSDALLIMALIIKRGNKVEYLPFLCIGQGNLQGKLNEW